MMLSWVLMILKKVNNTNYLWDHLDFDWIKKYTINLFHTITYSQSYIVRESNNLPEEVPV